MRNNLVYATDKMMLYVNLIIIGSRNYQDKLLLIQNCTGRILYTMHVLKVC